MDGSDIQSVTSDHFNHHVLDALKKSALYHDDMGNDVNNDEQQTDRKVAKSKKYSQFPAPCIWTSEMPWTDSSLQIYICYWVFVTKKRSQKSTVMTVCRSVWFQSQAVWHQAAAAAVKGQELISCRLLILMLTTHLMTMWVQIQFCILCNIIKTVN